MLQVTSAWRSAFPGAYGGILVLHDISNPAKDPELERRKGELMDHLRSQFSGQDRAALASHPTLQAYNTYYKRFKKTYHVQLQLESIVWKGKGIASVAALVEAMFMAELKNMLLTAGHDLDKVSLPLVLDISQGDERYTLMRGDEQSLKAGDMMIADQQGVISSIIYGPDRRTQISPETRNVLYTVYAPEGIAEQIVHRHLMDIWEYVLLFSPQAQAGQLKVHGSQGR